MGDKLNFYYLVDKMVIDGIFTDGNKDKVVEDIVDWIKTWYSGKIHENVIDMGIIKSILLGWSDVIEKVNMQTICKNWKPFDLVNAELFDQASTNISIVHQQMLRIRISSWCT